MFTEEQFHTNEDITQKELVQLRCEFYRHLSERLEPNSTGIYIAPGIDPIPYNNLKQRVVYFAHPSDGNKHKQILTTNPDLSSGVYQEYITTHGPFSNLQFDLGDIAKTSYQSASFKFLILRNPPIFITEEKCINEIDRLLTSDGIIVIDSEDDVSQDFTSYLNSKFTPLVVDYKFRQKNKIYPNQESVNNPLWYQGEHGFAVYRKKNPKN